MKFRKLSIENFKSFQYLTEIRFPDGANDKSIFLIGGMNGAGKTSLTEAVNYCLYGAKAEEIFKHVNRRERSKGNVSVGFELLIEQDDHSELIVKRSWSAGATNAPKPKDMEEKLVVVHDGKRVSVQNKEMWQDFIRATVPPGITQFFFFDGEKIQEIAADDHSEVRLKSSLEAALGIKYIKKLAEDVVYIKSQERQGYVEISDEDLNFKESELKREHSKLKRKREDHESIKQELGDLRHQHELAKKRFEATFNTAPESRDAMRENEKKRIHTANRLGQVNNEIKALCEKSLPYSIAGRFFGGIRKQIGTERESASGAAIKEYATELSKKIVRVVEEPEPIYREKLSDEKMDELERRIYKLLHEGDATAIEKVLDLSDRDAARVLHKIETIESSEIFTVEPLLEERRELEAFIQQLEAGSQSKVTTDSEQEIFNELQQEIEGCSTQIGRKTEQLRLLEEEVLGFEKKIRDTEIEIEKLYEKHNVSKEKADTLKECDDIASVLNQFIVRLRKNKVHMLQEKTFEMYRQLSSKSGLIKDIMIYEKTYEISIVDSSGHEIKKSALAAGEKQIFAVSLLWGLAQTSQVKLPIIIDTPLSRLDSTHRDNIINNYFPNAGDQVVILSTDTEIDNEYYSKLKPHLSGAGCLEFDQLQELTTFKEGYFWEK